MPDAFISYSRTDAREFVVRLREALVEHGKEPWVDLEEIPPASLWEDELRQAIAKSDSFVFVISPAARSRSGSPRPGSRDVSCVQSRWRERGHVRRFRGGERLERR